MNKGNITSNLHVMRKIYLILSVFTFLFCACYDDEGNYNYGDINELKISNLPDSLLTKFKGADTLKIEPKIEGTLAGKDEANYEYSWTAILQNGKGEATKAVEIGTEKNLNYFIELAIGKYDINLNILDRETKVTWRQGFQLEVSTATTTGWIVLCDQNGSVRLDMVSKIGKKEMLLRDLLKNFNMPNKKNPEKILMTLNYNNSNKPMDRILLITKTGTCYLDPEDLTWEEAFDYQYEMGMIPEVFQPTYVAAIAPRDDSWSRNILLTTTEVYCRKAAPSYFYELPKNYVNGETFRPAPFAITSAEDYFYQWEPPVLLYDVDHKQFVQLDMAWNGTSCRVPAVKNPVFDMVTGKDFVYATNTRQSSASSFVILKDDAGKLWLHGFGSIYQNTFKQLANYYYQLEAPKIEQATSFAVHPYFYFLFYVADNQIYQFDMVDKTCRQITPLDKEGKPVSLSGEEITFVKFNPLQYGIYSHKGDEDYKQIEYRLIVGSDRGGEDGGVIRMFDIQERMNNEVTLYKEYTGFAKPVDVVYRERE